MKHSVLIAIAMIATALGHATTALAQTGRPNILVTKRFCGRWHIFHRFVAWLRPDGILIFDVREWTRTLDRYSKNPLHRRIIELPTGKLEFQSETVLNLQSRRLCIRERFDIERNGVQTSTENDFVMRCWTPEEIAAHLSHAGLDPIATHSTYGEADLAWSDRLVVVALKRVHAPYVSTQ